MTRLSPVRLLALLLFAGLPLGEISAQAPPLSRSSGVPDLPPTPRSELVSSDGPSFQSRFWNAVAGAALGAGVGYFASQLASGDWEDGAINENRKDWALVGASIGLAAGFSFPFFGRGASLRPRMGSSPRTIITTQEVRDAAANTADEVVRLLRPTWLTSRRPTMLADPRCTRLDRVCEPISVDVMKVYLDGHRLGGTATLREINARNVETIRYFGAAEAVARWGAGHGQGAILVNTIG